MHLKTEHWVILGVLFISNVVTATALFSSPDMVSLWDGKQVAVTVAYADRVRKLQGSVDRLRSRELVSRGSSSLQLQELLDYQVQVSEQLSMIKGLEVEAAALGALPFEAPARRPELDRTDAVIEWAELDRVENDLREMEEDSAEAAAQLARVVDQAADSIVAELARLGYEPVVAGLTRGGPLLPPRSGAVDLQDADVDQVLEAMGRLREVRSAMDDVPIQHPLGTSAVSSSFGDRRDPFSGERAFHSGIDFPALSGTPVRSAARGTVTFVGWKGAYGNVVEVTHKTGLVSRYPHLSTALVEEGQAVGADEKIALVGSTGRSTGPHLHFEIRDQDRAIDPTPFLDAGRRLERFEG